MPTSPNSFSTIATLRPCGCVRMWLISVVLPAGQAACCERAVRFAPIGAWLAGRPQQHWLQSRLLAASQAQSGARHDGAAEQRMCRAEDVRSVWRMSVTLSLRAPSSQDRNHRDDIAICATESVRSAARVHT